MKFHIHADRVGRTADHLQFSLDSLTFNIETPPRRNGSNITVKKKIKNVNFLQVLFFSLASLFIFVQSLGVKLCWEGWKKSRNEVMEEEIKEGEEGRSRGEDGRTDNGR